jgi:hypothetical protein
MKKILFIALCLLASSSLWAQHPSANSSSHGYFNLTQLSFLIAEENDLSPIKSNMAPSVVNINGYRFNEHVSLGVGVGITAMSYVIVPVFADFRATLVKGNLSPVVALKGGYAFANSKKKIFNEYYGEFTNSGGAMVNPEVGFKVMMSERIDFMMTIGYWYQHVESEITNTGGYYQKQNRISDLNRLSFSVSFLFR